MHFYLNLDSIKESLQNTTNNIKSMFKEYENTWRDHIGLEINWLQEEVSSLHFEGFFNKSIFLHNKFNTYHNLCILIHHRLLFKKKNFLKYYPYDK